MNSFAQSFQTARLPNWLWLLAPGITLLPVWRWYVARLSDGSDDPLGVVALMALALIVARDRAQFAAPPRLRWLALSLVLSALAVLDNAVLPDLLCGVLAVLALSSALLAARSARRPLLAIIGLGLLALPLVSSLQFYVGFPLRVLTAEATSWLLRLAGYDALRDGSTLDVEGLLVMVDAPCSGIQMGWMAYFTACSAAAWLRLTDVTFVRRLPLVGLFVLIGNILRNTVLVIKEAHLVNWPEWTHEAVGVATFALVCGAVLRSLVNCPRITTQAYAQVASTTTAPTPSNDGRARAVVLGSFFALTVWTYAYPGTNSSNAAMATFEWPSQYQGRPLQPLALSVVEQRFAAHFPGTIGRFQTGDATLVLRHVQSPTRMLHPASDCFRGLGYGISQIQLRRNANDDSPTSLLRCFVAAKDAAALQVCEHIVDAAGTIYTDTSTWYWAALTGQSKGPWQSVTEAVPL